MTTKLMVSLEPTVRKQLWLYITKALALPTRCTEDNPELRKTFNRYITKVKPRGDYSLRNMIDTSEMEILLTNLSNDIHELFNYSQITSCWLKGFIFEACSYVATSQRGFMDLPPKSTQIWKVVIGNVTHILTAPSWSSAKDLFDIPEGSHKRLCCKMKMSHKDFKRVNAIANRHPWRMVTVTSDYATVVAVTAPRQQYIPSHYARFALALQSS